MNDYQREQFDTLTMIHSQLTCLSASEITRLRELARAYLQFRKDAQQFMVSHFATVCSRRCYQNHLSACCSKEGIITYFADIVINCLQSTTAEIDGLRNILQKPHRGTKCIYLGPDGCRWRVKPIVCEMFLCDAARQEVFAENPEAETQLEELNRRKSRFIWPDRPILFDQLENYFLDAGLFSPLMYMNTSPGLLRVKKSAGIPLKHRIKSAKKATSASKD